MFGLDECLPENSRAANKNLADSSLALTASSYYFCPKLVVVYQILLFCVREEMSTKFVPHWLHREIPPVDHGGNTVIVG